MFDLQISQWIEQHGTHHCYRFHWDVFFVQNNLYEVCWKERRVITDACIEVDRKEGELRTD